MKHSLSLSPKALTLSTGHTRILKAHAIYKVWDYQRGTAAGCWEDVEPLCVCVKEWECVCVCVCVCVWERESDRYPQVYLPRLHSFVMRGFRPFERMSSGAVLL